MHFFASIYFLYTYVLHSKSTWYRNSGLDIFSKKSISRKKTLFLNISAENNGGKKKKTRSFPWTIYNFLAHCAWCTKAQRFDLIWRLYFYKRRQTGIIFFHFHERKANILKPRPYLWAHVYYNLTNKCSFFPIRHINKK